MKKLLVLATGIRGGGLENFTSYLIRSLTKNHKVYIGCLINHLCKGHLKMAIRTSFKGIVGRLIFYIKSLFFIMREGINKIICNHIAMTPVPLITKKFFNTKYVVFAHGIEVWGNVKRPYLWGLRNAEKIICVSEFTKNILLKKHKIPSSKLYVLHPCVDTERFKPKDKNTKLAEKIGVMGKRVLLSVGRLSSQERYKGHEKVMEAVKLLIEKVPDIVYVIAGDGDDRRRLERYAKSLGIIDKVVFTGFIPNSELPDLYNLSDLFIMPSRTSIENGRFTGEGFGIVYIEAQSCGKPVIAGRYGGSSDALIDGETGFLVDPFNQYEIAEKILKIITNKNFSIRMGRKAREWVIKNFTCKEFPIKLQRLLSDFLD